MNMTAHSAATRLLALMMWLASLIAGLFQNRGYQTTFDFPKRSVEGWKPTDRELWARKLGVPVRYVEYVMKGEPVPYPILFRHIRAGGRTRADAFAILRLQVPGAADYIDHISRWNTLSALTLCFTPGDDLATEGRLISVAVAWRKAKEEEEAERAMSSEVDHVALAKFATPVESSMGLRPR